MHIICIITILLYNTHNGTCKYTLRRYLVAVSPDAHEKVVWLNVSMNEVLVVDKLNSPYHLYTIMHEGIRVCMKNKQ